MEVTEEHKSKTRELIKDGRSIEAIKYLRKKLRLDMTTAVKLVRAIRETIDPASIKPAPRLGQRSAQKIGLLLPGIFLVIGFGILIGAIYVYVNQQSIVSQGNLVTAKVIAHPSNPLFEYEFQGEIYQYQSSVESNPPSYVMGEQVDFYVNAKNPYDGIPDTFMDRWFVIVLLGGIGGVFSFVSFIVLFAFKFSSRK